MEHARRRNRGGARLVDGLHHVRIVARTARSNHRNIDCADHSLDELQIVAAQGAVPVYRCEQNFPRPAVGELASPRDRLAMRSSCTAMAEYSVRAIFAPA